MRRIPGWRGAALAASMLALAGVVAIGALPAAALSPNHSIFLYKPGLAHLGVYKDGVYTKKGSLALSNVTHAAASRSSLALYTKGTGRLRTGTFRGGAYTPVETVTIRTGFTHVAASCDTIMFYNRLTGRTLVGTLVGGRLRNRSTFTLATGWDRIAASCDSVMLEDSTHPKFSTFVSGVLSGGDYVPVQDTGDDHHNRFLAATSTSWISIQGDNLSRWGVASEGVRTEVSSQTLASWDLVAGTATSILFYRSDGDEACWRLVNGVASGDACANGTRPGWTIITGGR